MSVKFETWRAGVLAFTAERDYANPFLDVSVWAEFLGPNGEKIRREAYWDGGRSYKVSFAPTAAGFWRYTLSAPRDSGLDGVTGEVECVPYTGKLDIYRHGFLKISPDGRYFTYADGTPFFWLGDTHWGFVSGERWDESNHPNPKASSMFKYMVDKRVKQKFTVYQTNLRSEYRPGGATHYWADEGEGNLPDVTFYQNEVDKRMQYIADAGLVNALGFAWAGSVVGKLQLQKNLARYMVARYGALPMVWTLAGEVAGYSAAQREECINGWREVAKLVEELDGYGTLQTAHYTNERPFADYYQEEDWFDFTLNQAGHGDYPISAQYFRDHRAKYPSKPFVEGESLYEFVSTIEENGTRMATPDMIRRVAYMSIQLGGCGYTYGAQGIWETLWEKPEEDDPSNFFNVFNKFGIPWYVAVEGEGATQMGYMREFYEGAHFEQLSPAPECTASNLPFSSEKLFGMYVPYLTANKERTRFVAYYAPSSRGGFTIRGMAPGKYRAEWFDPEKNTYALIGEFETDGTWDAPGRPGNGDRLLTVFALR